MEKYSGIMKKRVSIIIFLSILLFIFSVPYAVFAEMLTVKGNKVNLRTGPGKQYSVKWEYGDGFPLQVIKKKGKWVKVKDFEGDSGWIYRKLLIDRPQMIVKANRGNDQRINIRSGPGTKKKMVGKAYYGVVFKTVEQKSGWVKVKHESGLEGWVKRSLLWGY
ncbi:MAG: SH3 domain-containing protein [Deltaproteobacteria bacterium]|nr:SH3 domain-containing protein [Deltaproteobacteria bacterium]